MAPRIRVCARGVALDAPLVALDEAASHHLARVLRVGEGDALALFDGEGRERDGRVETISTSKKTVQVRVALEGPARDGVIADRARVHVLQGNAKGDKLERVVRACAELGASAVWPAQCARSVVKLDPQRALAQHEHLQAVSASASEQSGRADLLAIEPLRPLQAALEHARSLGLRGCVADEAGGEPVAAWCERVASDPVHAPLAVLIGPEGGLTDEERAMAYAVGFSSISLGSRILRTEHAAAAFVAIASAIVGDGAIGRARR